MFKRILKKIMIAALVIVGVLVIAFLVFTGLYPGFGGSVSKERQLVYQKSPQFENGKFNNTRPVPKELSFSETISVAYLFFTAKVPNGRPKKDLKVAGWCPTHPNAELASASPLWVAVLPGLPRRINSTTPVTR